MDKPRAFQRTETEDKVKTMNKSRSISSASSSNKSTNIEQPKEINVRSDSPSISTSETLIKVKEGIQKPDNPCKRAKEDSITDEKDIIIFKNLHNLKIKKTTLAVLMRRHVNMMIIQVKLMVVQETRAKNIKMRKMKNTVKLHLKKMIVLNQNLVKG